MSTVWPTIEKQERRSGRSAHQVRKPGQYSGVSGLLARRSAWLVRINDLLAELEAAMGEIDALTGEIEGGGETNKTRRSGSSPERPVWRITVPPSSVSHRFDSSSPFLLALV